VVVADSLQNSTINKLSNLSVILVEAYFNKSTKSKSINYALNKLNSDYEAVIVLDADNVMSIGFLNRMSEVYCEGSPVVQGRRTALNENTRIAFLTELRITSSSLYAGINTTTFG